MRERVFDVATLISKQTTQNETGKKVLAAMNAAEEQAMALVSLFQKEHYLPVERLGLALESQNIEAVQLPLVAAYLAGYLAAENFDSRFDTALFGRASIGEGKGILVGTALMALLSYLDLSGKTELPDRRRAKKPTRRRAKAKRK